MDCAVLSTIIQVLNLNPVIEEMETLNTESLIERARGGDADAFCELCHPLETRLLQQAISLCGNTSLAEDLAQDTLIEAWKCLRRYNGRCQLFTWLCAILLHRYRNVLRKQRTLPFSALSAPSPNQSQNSAGQLTDQEPSPDEVVQRREQAALVHRCIQALPQKHQEVIHLRFYVDDSLEAIAAALDCSLGTVKSRLFHALKKLRGMNILRQELSSSKTSLEPYEALF